MGNHRIRILIAEPHPAMRHSLRLLLAAERDFELVGEVCDLASAQRAIGARHPDVLVLDLSLSDGNGLGGVSRLSQRAQGTHVVAISMHDEPGFRRAALDAGASGFVRKDLADIELGPAIRRATATD